MKPVARDILLEVGPQRRVEIDKRHTLGLCDGRNPLDCDPSLVEDEVIRAKLRTPNSQRIFYLAAAFRNGMSVDEVHDLTHIDPWFLHQIKDLVRQEIKLWDLAGRFVPDGVGEDREALAEEWRL